MFTSLGGLGNCLGFPTSKRGVPDENSQLRCRKRRKHFGLIYNYCWHSYFCVTCFEPPECTDLKFNGLPWLGEWPWSWKLRCTRSWRGVYKHVARSSLSFACVTHFADVFKDGSSRLATVSFVFESGHSGRWRCLRGRCRLWQWDRGAGRSAGTFNSSRAG